MLETVRKLRLSPTSSVDWKAENAFVWFGDNAISACQLPVRPSAATTVALVLFLAASEARAKIYWGNFSADTIGRANLDGTGVKQSFITGAGEPCGVEIDPDFIYWGDGLKSSVGRANRDGTGVNQSFITGTSDACGVAIDHRGFIYWGGGTKYWGWLPDPIGGGDEHIGALIDPGATHVQLAFGVLQRFYRERAEGDGESAGEET